MQLSPFEEQEFLLSHEARLRFLVLGYRRRAGSRMPDDTEDLMQEAR